MDIHLSMMDAILTTLLVLVMFDSVYLACPAACQNAATRPCLSVVEPKVGKEWPMENKKGTTICQF